MEQHGPGVLRSRAAWLPVAAALLVVAVAWRHQLGFWFTDTDTLADVVVARADGPGGLLRQLQLPLTGGYGGLNANFYRPVAMLHFVLLRALFDWQPLGWQAWDLGLHLLVLGLLAGLCRRLGAGAGEAALVVLVAGLHPIQAEVVPAVARNIDLLLAAFVVGGLLAVSLRRALLASALGLLALGTKEPAIALLPLFPLLWVVQHGRVGLGRLLWPWLVGVPLFLVLRSRVLGGFGGYQPAEGVELAGLWHPLRAAGLDALATPWALALAEAVGSGDLAQYGTGAVALGLVLVLGAAAGRRLGARGWLGLGLWLLPLGLMGLTESYTRRLLYVPALGLGLILAGLCARGGRWRWPALLALGLLAPGTPLWRPYLDWGEGARVAQAATQGLSAAWAAVPAGATVWLVDRPLRHNLDPRRAKFWQGRTTLNHGMGLYSLQAWVDERRGRGVLQVRGVSSGNPGQPLGAAAAPMAGGCLDPGRSWLRRTVNDTAAAAGWRADGGSLCWPQDAGGDWVLVFGDPSALVVLPAPPAPPAQPSQE